MKSFHNKVAVITGAGSGIGRALACAFAEQGCQLALVDVNAAALQETADTLARITDKRISKHIQTQLEVVI